MKVIYGVGTGRNVFKNAVVAIGVFDGVHIGHQKLIKAAVRRAKKLKVPAVVMTFSPHPVQALHPDSYLPFIVSLRHRFKLIEQLGVNGCVVVRFNKRFARLSPDQFIRKILVAHLHPKEVFVGSDFRFGKGREGDVEYFKESGKHYGYKVNAITPVKSGEKKIGSSRIRRLIINGRLNAAKSFLGRCVSIMGTVVKGDGRGKILGFPTVNVGPENEIILPLGAYAVYVMINNKRFKGMANVGRRPSFKKETNNINIEAHIFGFNGDLYGKEIIVEFVARIRSERIFQSNKKMAAQLKRDASKARRLLKSA